MALSGTHSAPAPRPRPRACEYGCDARLEPLDRGPDVPRDLDLDLGNRPGVLNQLKVQPAAPSQMVTMVREVLPKREKAS